jgi:hypothetical protein
MHVMTDEPVSSPQIRDVRVLRIAAVTVAASLIAWWPAFTLGVYGTIFFEQIFALWAAATASFLVAVLMLGRRGWTQPALYSLLVPSVWMILTWLTTAPDNNGGQDVLFWFGVVVTILGFPSMAALLVVVVVPGSESVRRSREVAVSIGVIAIIGVLSYVLGTQHPRLLTCEEFTISGNDQPAGCTAPSP